MNSRPPNRRWLRLRPKAGLIGHTADYTTLKSSSGSGGFCSARYRFQTSSATLPLVDTPYPRPRSLVAAALLRRQYIGIELEAKYRDLTRRRGTCAERHPRARANASSP